MKLFIIFKTENYLSSRNITHIYIYIWHTRPHIFVNRLLNCENIQIVIHSNCHLYLKYWTTVLHITKWPNETLAILCAISCIRMFQNISNTHDYTNSQHFIDIHCITDVLKFYILWLLEISEHSHPSHVTIFFGWERLRTLLLSSYLLYPHIDSTLISRRLQIASTPSRIWGHLAWVGMVCDGFVVVWYVMPCVPIRVHCAIGCEFTISRHFRNSSFHKYNSRNLWKCSEILKAQNKCKLEFPAPILHVKMLEYTPFYITRLWFLNVPEILFIC
jgi:hypothetical protein